MRSLIYLDNNATTHLAAPIMERMTEVWRAEKGNPASQHQMGRRARRVVEASRDILAEACGAKYFGGDADQVIFTSGGTEANNLAITGLVREAGKIVISSVEHPSVLAAAEHWQKLGRRTHRLSVRQNGAIELAELDALIEQHLKAEQPDDRIALVSVMLANNETGILFPVGEIAARCRAVDIPCHTDAVQALGKIRLNFAELGVDAMTVTAHKLHGPVGIGALIVREKVAIEPILRGGFQQSGIRPGTEPAALVAGFAAAAELAVAELSQRQWSMQHLRDRFEQGVRDICANAQIIGQESTRLPNTSCIAFPGYDRQQLQMALDLVGVACSTGSACASGSSLPSHVLFAMGFDESILDSSLRFSNSWETTEEQIDEALQRFRTAIQSMMARTA